MKFLYFIILILVILFLIIFEKNISYHYIFDIIKGKRKTHGELSVPLLQETKENKLIAHAAGSIDGVKYTNSLEAVNKSISSGISFIELDLRLTSDGHIVAVHDWRDLESSKSKSGIDNALTYSQYKETKIHSKFTTLKSSDILELIERENIYLVIDKLENLVKLSTFLGEMRKGKVIIEVFSIEKYNEAISLGFNNVALNINIKKFLLSSWLKLNKIKAVTYYGDILEHSHIAKINAKKLDALGIYSLIYFSRDPQRLPALEYVKFYLDDFNKFKGKESTE